MVSFRRIAASILGLLALAAPAVRVEAEVGSDRPAAVLVFPKILVDTDNPPSTPRGRVDTLIRISNTSDRPIAMKRFYVNANGHCRADPGTICDPYDLDAVSSCEPDDPCIAGWQETDFIVNLTAGQPVAWMASQGATRCDLSPDPTLPCFPLAENSENRVPPVPENPFIGYMKCLAVDRNEVPVERNDLIGDIQFVQSNDDVLDVESYAAIGIPAIPGQNNFDKNLVIGGSPVCAAGTRAAEPCEGDFDCPGSQCLLPEYEACPNILIMDHLFEGANDPISGETTSTILTFVPCSDDFEQQLPVSGPIQFLVFNEFEQRFSTSKTVTCFHEFRLPDIQGRTEVRSIFGAGVNGTLTGQTRMRGVVPGTKRCVAGSTPGQVCTQDNDCAGGGTCRATDNRLGYTWLGMVEEFRDGGGTSAFNLHFHGTRPESDFVRIP